MNQDFQNPNNVGTGEAEETLHLIARLPAPAGLEGRIHHSLRTAPRAMSHEGRMLAWPLPASMGGAAGREWMRAAAAAAIAFVIAGGGWGVYSRVEPRPAGPLMLTPHAAPGGFAGANAVRTPDTINGPVVNSPVSPGPDSSSPVVAHPAGSNASIGSAQAPVQASAGKKKAASTKRAGTSGQQAPAAQK
jgi:hypothetical protein